MGDRVPHVVLITGPNGAGKTTAAPIVLRDTLGIDEFVNADQIALGLSAFSPETTAFEAGRVMLRRLRDLAHVRADFAFESTLASRSFARFLKKIRSHGYAVHIVFLWLRSPQLANERVARRVATGGHNLPTEIVERRYFRGLNNFFELYVPLADDWRVYDNSRNFAPRLVANAVRGRKPDITEPLLWERIKEAAHAQD